MKYLWANEMRNIHGGPKLFLSDILVFFWASK